LAITFQATCFGEYFQASQVERQVGDAVGIQAHQARRAIVNLELHCGGELVAGPLGGGQYSALDGGLTVNPEVPIPAVAGSSSCATERMKRKWPGVRLPIG